MSQLPQLLRNTLIRIIGSFSRFVEFFLQFFSQLGRGISQLLGWQQEGYFLENNDSQSTKRLESRPSNTVTVPPQQSSADPKIASTVGSEQERKTTRRHAGKEMNSFRTMARQIRNS
ncbi:MAG TPA: hypothetical protein V6C65_12220 [Allocoleopsis sp.]